MEYMPAVIPVHAEIRSRLRESAEYALKLNTRLEAVIAVKPRRPSSRFHGKIDFSSPPWYAPVADCVMNLHALTRKLEKDIRAELELPLRIRGGSDANTGKALEAAVRLCQGAHDYHVREMTRELEKWSRRAAIALEEAEIPRRLPRVPGGGEPACPFCGNHTLRSKPLDGEIFCINPACTDQDGRKPKAHMEYSPVARDWIVLWQDGIPGVPAAA